MADRTDLSTVIRLLQGSVAVWRVEAEVEAVASEPPTARVRHDGGSIYVTRRSGEDMPPCWEVRRTDTTPPPGFAGLPARTYAAVPGMLRAVRAALDPEARSGRLIIGAAQA